MGLFNEEEEKERILREIKAYESKIILYSSLKLHLERKHFKVFVEYEVERTVGNPDTPDIFAISANFYSFIEEKGSLPKDTQLLEKEISEVLEYSTEHKFEGRMFLPQVILLCPADIYADRVAVLETYKRQLCIVTYAFPLDDPFVLTMAQGKVLDLNLLPCLAGDDKIDHARRIVPAIKFLRYDPPVPYTAWYIWQTLWSFATTSKDNFIVRYSAIIEKFRAFYPSWLGRNIEQITYGRLNKGLELLLFVNWISYRGSLNNSTEIKVHYSKGDRIRAETLHYLVSSYIRMEERRSIIPSKMRSVGRARALKAAPKDTKLDQYFKTP